MPKPDLQPVNLGSISRGALMELFEIEIDKIAKNIAGTKTKATQKRKLVLELTFAPDIDRKVLDITANAKTKLACIADHASRAYLGKGTDGQPYILKAGNTVQVDDDGFGQTVTLKAGEVNTVEKKIEPRIKLIPLRTFSECNPVESEFLIRFQQTRDQTPSIALFDLEGTKWQGDLMRSIKKYLVDNLPENVPVLA
jgi:hypothetical protein